MEMIDMFPTGSSIIVKRWLTDNEENYATMNISDEEPQFSRYDGSPTLNEGDQVNLFSLLSGKQLVRQGNGEVVEISSLNGKYVIILSVTLPIYVVTNSDEVAQLRALQYSWSTWKDDGVPIELVVVAKMRGQLQYSPEFIFRHFVSAFPGCLEFPFDDPACCDFVVKSLGLYICNSDVVFLDPDHRVLLHSFQYLRNFGARCYPFTRKNLDRLHGSSRRIVIDPPASLARLLHASHAFKYDEFSGKQVLVHGAVHLLNLHIVGLYLCTDGSQMDTIKDIWSSCSLAGLDLQIVVVYSPYSDDSKLFIDIFNDMIFKQWLDWWFLPFDDSTSRKIQLLCYDYYYDYGYDIPDQLIMYGPNGSFLEPDAIKIVNSHKAMDMYPFSKKFWADKEATRLKNVTLWFLLSSINFVCKNTGNNVAIDSIMGKDVLVYFVVTPYPLDSNYGDLMTRLYDEKQFNDFEFELVFVFLNDDIDLEWFQGLPFPALSCIPNIDHRNNILWQLFPANVYQNNELVAFGKDGHIMSFNPYLRLCNYGIKAFPFPDTLAEDVYAMYNTSFGAGAFELNANF